MVRVMKVSSLTAKVPFVITTLDYLAAAITMYATV